MRIVLLHYHLKPGGVTTVLLHQIKAIQSFGEILVLVGEPPDFPLGCDWVCLPELAYNNSRPDKQVPDEVAEDIGNAVFNHWKKGCDLIHIHNPTLAKNRQFLEIIKALQKLRFTLFLQIHDFAEDGRPSAYYNEDYPRDCHYGVINKRDYGLLLSAGLEKGGLHLLENAIDDEVENESHDHRPKHVLYPVRAIRRKNIGEAILVSIFWSSQYPLQITLPPNSEQDFQSYKFWKEFCANHLIHVEFEAGHVDSLRMLMAESLFVLSTSISEGFGFSFLEAWLYNKPMWGRYLPNICEGFELSGINLSHLYKYIEVPLDWIGFDSFKEEWISAINAVSGVYNYEIPKQRVIIWLEGIVSSGGIDFSFLTEKQQAQVIEIVISNDKARREFSERNPFMQSIESSIPEITEIDKNKKVILNRYGPDQYKENLKNTYQKVIQSSIEQKIDRWKLLEEFLSPDQFHMMKWRGFNR